MSFIRPGLIAFWFWNDGSTTEEKLRYIRRCHAGGIGALVMHCRSGNLVPYASDQWFAQIRAAVEAAARLDMHMWLYDEDPYPSGAAGGMVMAEYPELTARSLGWRTAGPRPKPGSLWSIGEEHVVWAGLVPRRAGLLAQDLTTSVGTIRTDWFMGDWDSRWYYPDTPLFNCPRGDAVRQCYAMRVPRVPTGMQLAAVVLETPGEEGSWGALPDLLNPRTFDVFRALSLDKYRQAVGAWFGNTIPGIFTDEAKPHGGLPVTPDLFAAFTRCYGYDLRPRLYQLFGKPLTDQWLRTRLDYRRWVGQRFRDAFVQPYREYCDRQGLLLVGHMSPEDDPVQEARTIVSVGAIMKTMHCPGTDLIIPTTGDHRAPAVNLGSLRAASIKTQHGHAYCTSETLGLSPYGMTTARVRQLLTWQKVLGIDRIFVHGFFNSNEGVAAYEAPPDFGPDSSTFAGLQLVDRWLRRLDAFTDAAEDSADVAVLCSLTSFLTLGPGAIDRRVGRLRRSLWTLVVDCLRAHVGIQVVEDDDLRQARCYAGALAVGARRYATVLVPAVDLLQASSLRQLGKAHARGVAVHWFGNGPRRAVGKRSRLKDIAELPGTVHPDARPGAAWCRRHLPGAARLVGKSAEVCYVRRFTSHGKIYLLAVNTAEHALTMRLCPEGGQSWAPVTDMVDGTYRRTTWSVPARGAGLFCLGPRPPEGRVRAEHSRPVSTHRHFTRLAPNTLRLCPCVAHVGDLPPVQLDYPRPYWQLCDAYTAERTQTTYMGELPVESRVAHRQLQYMFTFNAAGAEPLKPLTLILEPRCARGRFRVWLNDTAVGPARSFPLTRTAPLRLRLPRLAEGHNTVTARFDAQSAMDGLLAQLLVEGDFDVCVEATDITVSPPDDQAATTGWTRMGLPHYAGAGRYTWEETFSAAELGNGAWTLELERVVDHAELRVNGLSQGARAWPPWHWPLHGLRPGTNRFELTARSTVGNRRTLRWPDEPQGWLGSGRLRHDDQPD